jgi:hypothetical protein
MLVNHKERNHLGKLSVDGIVIKWITTRFESVNWTELVQGGDLYRFLTNTEMSFGFHKRAGDFY